MYQYHPEKAEKGVSSGSYIRATRELRKLTILELSDLTSIDGAVIENAENNINCLDVKQIEKIALALKCHPSKIAFPYWDMEQDLPQAIIVEGKLSINGVRKQDSTLSVHLTKYSGLAIGWGRISIDIGVFNDFMLTGLGYSPRVKGELSSKMEGDCLGRCFDNYSYGSEFDCDNRVIKAFTSKVCYFRDCVSVEIEGFASAIDGYVNDNRLNPNNNDWDFSAKFLISRNSIQKFYGLSDSAIGFILKDMERLDLYDPKK